MACTIACASCCAEACIAAIVTAGAAASVVVELLLSEGVLLVLAAGTPGDTWSRRWSPLGLDQFILTGCDCSKEQRSLCSLCRRTQLIDQAQTDSLGKSQKV